MNRAENRRMAKKVKKKVKDMGLGEFDRIMQESIGGALEKGHAEGFEFAINMYEKALKEEFGFGEKRLDRVRNRITNMIEGVVN